MDTTRVFTDQVVITSELKKEGEVETIQPAVQKVFRVNPQWYTMGPPAAPSLWKYLEAAEVAKTLGAPAFHFGQAAPLGVLVALMPNTEVGGYIGVFTRREGHPAQIEGNDGQGVVQLLLTPEVVTAIINGGVLHGDDNFCFGRMHDGAVQNLIAFVEQE